eukprot:4835985-Ditylum_brightwellii.AAC.1
MVQSEVSWLTTEANKSQALEASGSAKLSGHGAYGMPPCCMNYRSRYSEQFVETHASGLDPV